MPSYTKNKLSVKSELSLKSSINFNEGLCIAIKFSSPLPPTPPCIGCQFWGLALNSYPFSFV